MQLASFIANKINPLISTTLSSILEVDWLIRESIASVHKFTLTYNKYNKVYAYSPCCPRGGLRALNFGNSCKCGEGVAEGCWKTANEQK